MLMLRSLQYFNVNFGDIWSNMIHQNSCIIKEKINNQRPPHLTPISISSRIDCSDCASWYFIGSLNYLCWWEGDTYPLIGYSILCSTSIRTLNQYWLSLLRPLADYLLKRVSLLSLSTWEWSPHTCFTNKIEHLLPSAAFSPSRLVQALSAWIFCMLCWRLPLACLW